MLPSILKYYIRISNLEVVLVLWPGAGWAGEVILVMCNLLTYFES